MTITASRPLIGNLCDKNQKSRLFSNIADAMQCLPDFIIERQVDLFEKVSLGVCERRSCCSRSTGSLILVEDRRTFMSKLFVGNLSFTVTDADLQTWFESNGYPVDSAHVMTDHKTGRSRGIAFVVLKQNDQLKDAIENLNGKTLSGRTVNVEEAKSPASNEGPHPQKRGRW